jgi:hypothetical protein
VSEPDIFKALENFSEAVSMLSGVRQQFLAQGWSPPAAEMATIALLQVMHNGDQG